MDSSNITQKPSRNNSSILPFFIAQLCLVGVAAAGITWRTWQIDARSELPPLRESPRNVEPQFDEPTMVTDDDLRRVLRKLRPRFNGPDTKIGHVDHNLRFWGAEATFDEAGGEPKFVSGEQMRKLLLDHNAFTKLYGDISEKKPLLLEIKDEPGLRFREFEGKLSSPHDDHTMACLAEVGTPLSYPVVTPQRETTFRDIVEQSLRDFRLNQSEYEWSALTYALFIDGVNHWVTTEGQEVSFDMLADRIIRQPMPQGVCMGNHRLHALVVMLRVHETWDGPQPLLSPAAHDRVVKFLRDKTQKLFAHQHSEGFWNIDWYTETPKTLEATEREGDRLGDRIIVTGHALEWWALLPKDPTAHNRDKYDILPPRATRVKAARWLVKTIEELGDQPDNNQVLEFNSFLSHAGRALALWRGKFPSDVDLTTPEAPQE